MKSNRKETSRFYNKINEASIDNRTKEMVDDWKKEGRAFSNIKYDDTAFFDALNLSWDEVGITSQSGSGIIYYNPKMYKSSRDAINGKYMSENKMKTTKQKLVENKLRQIIKKIINESYEGYKNEDTYNAALYIENEGKLYSQYESKIGSLTANDAKMLFQKLRIYNREGFAEVNQKVVDWQEVAESLNLQ